MWGILGMVQVLSIRYIEIIPILNKLSYNFKLGLHIITGISMFILSMIFISIVDDSVDDIHI